MRKLRKETRNFKCNFDIILDFSRETENAEFYLPNPRSVNLIKTYIPDLEVKVELLWVIQN